MSDTAPTEAQDNVPPTMPRRTNHTRREMLKDLLETLLEDEDHSIFDMLQHNNVRSIHQLCSRDHDGLQGLQTTANDDIDFQLYMDLVCVRRFVKYMQLRGTRIDQAFIVHLGIEEYEHFVISGHNSSTIETMTSLSNNNDDASATNTLQSDSITPRRTRKVEPVRDFERGIKRDVTLFSPLTDDAKWDQFRLEFDAQIDAQGLFNAINADYEPPDEEHQQLLQLQRKFVYSAFLRCLKMDATKTIVRKHEKTKDALQIYQDLIAYFTTSTKAELDTVKLLEYITTSHIDDGWSGTAKGYVLHWMEQIRLYRTIKPDAYSDEQLRIMLQTAVNPNPDLRQIGAQDDYARATGTRTPSFEQYFALIKAAAERYDASHATKRT